MSHCYTYVPTPRARQSQVRHHQQNHYHNQGLYQNSHYQTSSRNCGDNPKYYVYSDEASSKPPLSSSLGHCYREPLSDLTQYVNPRTHQAQVAILAHEKERKIKSEETYKTVMCKNWIKHANCDFGKNCRFAHGEHELRHSRAPVFSTHKYKTRLCDNYLTGICQYGVRCLFIHPGERLVLTAAQQAASTTTFGPPTAATTTTIVTNTGQQFPSHNGLQLMPSPTNCCAPVAPSSNSEVVPATSSSGVSGAIGGPTVSFQQSNYMVNFMGDSPPELQNFTISLPSNSLPPFSHAVSANPRKNKNLLPQVQQELRMEKNENRRKQLLELVKKQDRILASADKKRNRQGSSTIINNTSPKSSSNSNSNRTSPPTQKTNKSYEPFDENFEETLVSTLSHVLDTSDLA